jgi:glycosyltransferase involved in cell wall biosynthesis
MQKQKKILLVGLFLTEQNKHRIIRSSSDRLAELFTKNNIPVLTVSTKVDRLPRLSDTVKKMVKYRNEYDIAVIPLFGGLSLVLEHILTLVLKSLGKKIVLVVRGGAIPEKMKTQAKYYLPVLKRADVIVSPSRFSQSCFKSYGFDCTLIENVVNLDNYTFNRKPTFRPHLFWMRTFEDVYNPEMAVRLAALLSKKYPDFKMVMAGYDHGSLTLTKDLANELNVSDKIEFKGYIENDAKNKYASDLDFYICTNRIDNAPVSFIEMMALGMPIITVNSGGIPYMVTHNENVLMVNLDDDQAMADCISSVIDQPAIGHRIVENAFQYSKQFGEEPVVKKWMDVFNELGFEHSNELVCAV